MSKPHKIVCVWKDTEYHPDGEAWIVSIDSFDENNEGVYSDTQSDHKKFEDAKAAGEALAETTGYPLTICE